MAGSDLQRAHYIRLLYERCLDKQPSELDEAQRALGASLDMTRKLGPNWAEEMDGLTDNEADDQFYAGVEMLGEEEGKGTAPVTPDAADSEKDDLIIKILDLLRKL